MAYMGWDHNEPGPKIMNEKGSGNLKWIIIAVVTLFAVIAVAGGAFAYTAYYSKASSTSSPTAAGSTTASATTSGTTQKYQTSAKASPKANGKSFCVADVFRPPRSEISAEAQELIRMVEKGDVNGLKKKLGANPEPFRIPGYVQVIEKAAELGKIDMIEALIHAGKVVPDLEKAALIAEFSGHPKVCDKIIQLGGLAKNCLEMYCRWFKEDVTEEDVQFFVNLVKRFDIDEKVDVLLSAYDSPVVFKVLLNLPEFVLNDDEKKRLMQEVVSYQVKEMTEAVVSQPNFTPFLDGGEAVKSALGMVTREQEGEWFELRWNQFRSLLALPAVKAKILSGELEKGVQDVVPLRLAEVKRRLRKWPGYGSTVVK